jgi:Zn-dependent peptidase ImmA (M78 family)
VKNHGNGKEFARQKAKEVLNAYRIPRCSNRDLLERIIEAFSIQFLQWEHFHNSVCGMLLSYHDKFYIVVNKLHPDTRRLFTIAHELGHFFLHTTLNKPYHLYLEQPGKYSAECAQANCFAANLLMPRKQVYELTESGYTIQQMADYFQVSYSAMLLRLRKLKIALSQPQDEHNYIQIP